MIRAQVKINRAEVLARTAEGQSTKQIGDYWGVSSATIWRILDGQGRYGKATVIITPRSGGPHGVKAKPSPAQLSIPSMRPGASDLRAAAELMIAAMSDEGGIDTVTVSRDGRLHIARMSFEELRL